MFFGWLWRKMVFFVKMSFLGKIGKHYLCSEGAHFRCNYLFLENAPFFGAHSKSPNTTKIGVFTRKGVLLSVIPKSCALLKTLFYSVFSKTQLCRHERLQLEQKQKFTKNRGCLPKCKKVFFWYVFFAFWWFCFLLPVFLSCVCKKAQKGYFPAILEVFCLFCSHQRPVWKWFFSSCFVFFCFCLPFQKSIFCFLSINPFLQKTLCGVSFLFLLLAFSFPKVLLVYLTQLS